MAEVGPLHKYRECDDLSLIMLATLPNTITSVLNTTKLHPLQVQDLNMSAPLLQKLPPPTL